MKTWKNKVCIITGSSIGIGRKLATELAKKGARVVLNARNAKRLLETERTLREEGLNVTSYPGDVSQVEACQNLVEHTIKTFGRLDILINNAGISADGMVEGFSPDLYQKVVHVNFLGPVYMTQASLPYLKETHGSIVFVGSIAGFHGFPNHSAYCSTKMALTALAESLNYELGNLGIHVGIAYLGFTENDKEKTIYDNQGNIIPQPDRGFGKSQPVLDVVYRIISLIEKRRFSQTFSVTGKLLAFLNRMFPTLLQFALSYFHRKQLTHA